MKIYLSLILLCFCLLSIEAESQNFPFPQHASYASGTIKPNNVTQAQLDDSTQTFYKQWRVRYLKNDCGPNQYYVWFDENSPDSAVTVSEGHGYGMIIVAYMAGYDPSDKIYFDGLYNFYKAHPSAINNNLMAWRQIKGCVDSPDGQDAATDGDLDIAYALLLADKQWGSTGAINYLQEARTIINAIMQAEINPAIWTTKLSDAIGPLDSAYYDTRSSDFIVDHFRAFQKATGDSNWTNVINRCYSLVSAMQTNFSPATGLIPDFIRHCNTTPIPAQPNYLESPYDGNYFYNACRGPWRLGIDYLMSGDSRAKTALDRINTWIKTKTNGNPVNIGAGYYLNGNDIPGNSYYSAAFVGPFAVGAMVNTVNQTWLNNLYAHLLSLQLRSYKYYDNTLKMLSLIVLSGNWWAAQLVTGVKKFQAETPRSFGLEQNYPNPFNPSTIIACSLPLAGYATLKVFNTLGQEVVILLAQELGAGRYETKWDGTGIGSGTYFYRLQIGKFSETKKLMLLR